MLPATSGVFEINFDLTTQPSYTYQLNLDIDHVRGYADGQEAVKQAIYKILNTERYQYEMYSWNYGIELKDLYGKPVPYVVPELERRITEALTWDDRINSVDDFDFDTSRRGIVAVTFTAHTIYGDVESEMEADI